MKARSEENYCLGEARVEQVHLINEEQVVNFLIQGVEESV